MDMQHERDRNVMYRDEMDILKRHNDYLCTQLDKTRKIISIVNRMELGQPLYLELFAALKEYREETK